MRTFFPSLSSCTLSFSLIVTTSRLGYGFSAEEQYFLAYLMTFFLEYIEEKLRARTGVTVLPTVMHGVHMLLVVASNTTHKYRLASKEHQCVRNL